jgi:hypothetical protein
LSKQLAQASFANTYVGVSDHFDLKEYIHKFDVLR